MEEIVYFELNNWRRGETYPNESPLFYWMDYPIKFLEDKWVEENKLVVVTKLIDMSINICVSAPKVWVEENCPFLLTKYTDFLRYPDKDGKIEGIFSNFLPYTIENIGVHY